MSAKLPKLLPCPFCGGKAEFQSQPSPWLTAYWRVDCGGTCPENMVVFARGATKKEATETWNRRALADKGKVVERGWRCKTGTHCWCGTPRCGPETRKAYRCRRIEVRVVEEGKG
jgi:hypothetical protein